MLTSRTAKYQLHRTTSDGDNSHPNIGRPSFWQTPYWSVKSMLWESALRFQSNPHPRWILVVRWWAGENWWSSTGPNINLIYLRHQWSDGADTLQFGSTDEYFETVEYEPDRSVEHWDIPWKPPDLEIFDVLKIFVIFKDFSVLVGKWWLLGFSEADLDGQEDFGGQPGHWR